MSLGGTLPILWALGTSLIVSYFSFSGWQEPAESQWECCTLSSFWPSGKAAYLDHGYSPIMATGMQPTLALTPLRLPDVGSGSKNFSVLRKTPQSQPYQYWGTVNTPTWEQATEINGLSTKSSLCEDASPSLFKSFRTPGTFQICICLALCSCLWNWQQDLSIPALPHPISLADNPVFLNSPFHGDDPSSTYHIPTTPQRRDSSFF